MKLAFIDLDGVVVNSIVRFQKAQEAKDKYLASVGFFKKLFRKKQIKKKAEDLYWGTAFTPDLVSFDTLIDKALELIDQIEEDYRIMFLSSRPEAMRAATQQWLVKHNLAVDAAGFQREMALKANAFQYTKTISWKVGMIQQLVPLFGVTHILFVDDENKTREALLKASLPCELIVAGSLPEAVKKLGE